jgi:hypothetical protein
MIRIDMKEERERESKRRERRQRSRERKGYSFFFLLSQQLFLQGLLLCIQVDVTTTLPRSPLKKLVRIDMKEVRKKRERRREREAREEKDDREAEKGRGIHSFSCLFLQGCSFCIDFCSCCAYRLMLYNTTSK